MLQISLIEIFFSCNEIYQPIIKALDIIKKYYNIGTHYFADTEYVPIDGVVKSVMMDAIIEKDAQGQERINRINYEIATLQSLRDKLRCKEIWGVGANRYRNPDEDQELSVLSLHLLQNCLVYINTLMIQQILSERKWYDMMTPEDFRALTPLIYNHVNPYGNFHLDMSQRIPISTHNITPQT